MKKTKRYDEETKTIILDKEYLFSFTKSDGFSDRLLLAELTVDWQYQYSLEMGSFESRNRKDNLYFETAKLPLEIINDIEVLISADYRSLKNNYDYEFSIDDLGQNYFHFNFDEVTSSIVITLGVSGYFFESDVEKLLFKLNKRLAQWIEEKYRTWISN